MSCDHELANEWARCNGKNPSYITIHIIYHTNHPSQCEPGRGIVRAIVKRWNVIIFIPGCVAFKKLRMSCRVQNTDRLRTEQGSKNEYFMYGETKTSMHVHSKSNYNDHELLHTAWSLRRSCYYFRDPSSFVEGNAWNPLGIKTACLFSFIPNQTKNNSSLPVIHIATPAYLEWNLYNMCHEVTEDTTSRIAIGDEHFLRLIRNQ